MNQRTLRKVIGPGILFASTAIGVSHLVQSTRAGATYGMGLLAAVVLSNLFKYPFFEYGSRYSNSTGKSLIEGYKSIGRGVLVAYIIVTISSMFFVAAAVGSVTSGFMQSLFGLEGIFGGYTSEVVTGVLFLGCVGLLARGSYRLLDQGIKIIGTVLFISTITAFILVIVRGPAEQIHWVIPEFSFGSAALPFVISLMGWMPTAVDLSVWNSLWTLERIKQTGYKPTLKETLFDFRLGYLISALLAILFLVIGAWMMYGTGIELVNSPAGFAIQITTLFTSLIGSWSWVIIGASAFTIMFGTCIAVFDGYSRSINRAIGQFTNKLTGYNLWLIILGVGSLIIVLMAGGKLKGLVDLATAISFIIAPIVAIANFYLVTGNRIAKKDQPGGLLRVLSVMGIVFLVLFSLVFLVDLALE